MLQLLQNLATGITCGMYACCWSVLVMAVYMAHASVLLFGLDCLLCFSNRQMPSGRSVLITGLHSFCFISLCGCRYTLPALPCPAHHTTQHTATQVAVPYDWRLPIPVMESRDGFFTRVRVEVEMQLKLAKGIKPVMVSHSYGAAVTMAFLDWVERQNPGWVDQHLHGYINVAGPILGLPKAISPLLSGRRKCIYA